MRVRSTDHRDMTGRRCSGSGLKHSARNARQGGRLDHFGETAFGSTTTERSQQCFLKKAMCIAISARSICEKLVVMESGLPDILAFPNTAAESGGK